MSVKVMSLVWEAAGLGATDKLILLALADHADDAGMCYPSIRRLCERCGLSERAVQTAIKRLQDIGWLVVQQNAGPRGCNLFQVTPPALNAPRSICTPAANAPTPRSICGEPPQHMHPNRHRTINKPSLSLSADDELEDAYRKLMDVFPKRHVPHPRKQTLKSLKAALKDERLENILGGAKLYAAQIRAEGNEGRSFVKMASTWLNNECWKDFAPQPEKPSGPNWPRRAQIWRESGGWSEVWGPPPSSPDFNPPPECKHLFERQMSLT